MTANVWVPNKTVESTIVSINLNCLGLTLYQPSYLKRHICCISALCFKESVFCFAMDSLCVAFLVLCKYFLSFISIDLKSVKMHFLGNLQSIWFVLNQIRVCEICKSFHFYSHSIPTFFGTGVVDHILVTLCLLLQFFKCVHFALVIILKKCCLSR